MASPARRGDSPHAGVRVSESRCSSAMPLFPCHQYSAAFVVHFSSGCGLMLHHFSLVMIYCGTSNSHSRTYLLTGQRSTLDSITTVLADSRPFLLRSLVAPPHVHRGARLPGDETRRGAPTHVERQLTNTEQTSPRGVRPAGTNSAAERPRTRLGSETRPLLRVVPCSPQPLTLDPKWEASPRSPTTDPVERPVRRWG